MPLQIGDGAPADQREPAIQTARQLPQQGGERRRNPDRVRRLGKLHQGAVEIEKERRSFEQRRGRRGKVHRAPLARAAANLKPGAV